MASGKEEQKSVDELLWESIRSRSSSPFCERPKVPTHCSETGSARSEVESTLDSASSSPGRLASSQQIQQIPKPRCMCCLFHAGAQIYVDAASSNFQDGLVAFKQEEWIITSPNVTFIPQPVHGRVIISRHGDGHYGAHDPIQWPQQFVSRPDYIWLVAVARKPQDCSDHRMPIWAPLPTSALVCISHSLYITYPGRRALLGDLVNSISARAANFTKQCGTNRQLQLLVDSLHEAYERLNFPSTRRDMIHAVACVQRYWLFVDAWIEFYVYLFPTYSFVEEPDRRRLKPRVDLMGAFTTEPLSAQRLFAAGIPVWFMRHQTRVRDDEVILEWVKPTLPPALPSSSTGSSIEVCSTWAGERHIAAITIHSRVSVDIPAQYALSGTIQPTFSDAQDGTVPLSVIRRENNRHSSRQQPCMFFC